LKNGLSTGIQLAAHLLEACMAASMLFGGWTRRVARRVRAAFAQMRRHRSGDLSPPTLRPRGPDRATSTTATSSIEPDRAAGVVEKSGPTERTEHTAVSRRAFLAAGAAGVTGVAGIAAWATRGEEASF
jgi:hypothetical protein